MRQYEITFIDLGFLCSSELWLSWLVAGLVVGFLLIAQDLINRRWRFHQKKHFGWLLAARIFTVAAWPISIYLWFKVQRD